MCGIAGIARRDAARAEDHGTAAGIAAMLAALTHRGPDGVGSVVLDGVTLGHRRLAVIDLTERGAQPMPLGCGEGSEPPAAWIVLNGEIYNFTELRAELEAGGHRFRSDSDTETVLHLYEEEGPDCVRRLRGMFAFALWDAARRRLVLARDRIGKKPLFYRDGPRDLSFASELKALVALSRARGEPVEPDAASLGRYMVRGYVPGPATAVKGIRKLPPGHMVILERGEARLRAWWTLPDPGEELRDGPDAFAERVRATVDEAVRLRLRSDVPVGLFLSGGLDSGIVAARMMAHVGRLKTFTVGFGERNYDETAAASRTAAALGAEHRTIDLTLDPGRIADALPDLAWSLDQPLGDSSALAVWHMAREVRRHVTVALSGDGGDELFLGYDRHRAHRLAERLRRARLPGRATLAVARLAVRAAAGLPSGRLSRRNLAGRLDRFVRGVGLPAGARNDAWIACFDGPLAAATFTPDFQQAAGSGGDPIVPAVGKGDPLDAIRRADLTGWLPDDILHKADAATMAHGLEARSPLLDHHVVELAMRIPPALHLDRSGLRAGKAMLRRAFAGDLPEATLRGPKRGFGSPLDHWLRNGLEGHVRDVLLSRAARTRGIVHRDGVEALLTEHTRGIASHEAPLWALVMLEHWFRVMIDGARLPATIRAAEAAR